MHARVAGVLAPMVSVFWLIAPAASGQDPADEVLVPAETTRGAEEPPPEVGLDDLLRLPRGYGGEIAQRGGATALEWRGRFEVARAGIDSAKKRLEVINAELDQMSGSSSAWAVSAPGAQDPQASPLSLRLRQEMKEQRALIEDAERELRALRVEADLAGVPPEWREPRPSGPAQNELKPTEGD